jgi:hypothetical protein
MPVEGFQRHRIHRAGRLAAGGIRREAPTAEMIEQGLGKNRAGGVAGAQHQHIERACFIDRP